MTTPKAKPPAPLRKPATKDHLRKKPLISRWMSFVTKDIPEPRGLDATASAEQRTAYLKVREKWQEQIEAATVEFKIQSMTRRAYRELKDAHPPTDEDFAKAKRRDETPPDVHEASFAPALIAKSITEPGGMELEDGQAIWEEWEEGEATFLYGACRSLNESFRLEFYQKKSDSTGG